MAGIEEDTVAGRVEYSVQRNGEFDCTEVRPQVTSSLRDIVHQEAADLSCQGLEFLTGERVQLPRVRDSRQQRPVLAWARR